MITPRTLYKEYIKKAKTAGKTAISRPQFNEALEKQRKIVSYMLSLGRTKPWIASRLGDDFILYAEVKGTDVIINVWTTQEYTALTGEKLSL